MYFSLSCSRQLLGYNICLELILALLPGFTSSSCNNQTPSWTIKQWNVPCLMNSNSLSRLPNWGLGTSTTLATASSLLNLGSLRFVNYIISRTRNLWGDKEPGCIFYIQTHFTLFLLLVYRILAITCEKRPTFLWGWWQRSPYLSL